MRKELDTILQHPGAGRGRSGKEFKKRGYGVHRIHGTLFLILLIGGFACPTLGQEGGAVRPWWIGAEFGEGQFQLNSDQVHRNRKATFALGFVGGHSLGNRARIGLELNGWLLQAFNLNDPTVGESVSNALVAVDAFPIRKVPFFLRAGTGGAFYQNNRPEGFGGSGWCWTTGVGYEIRLGKNFGLAPMVNYSAGSFGEVRNVTTIETGRSYSVVGFVAGVIWHFGKTR